MIRSAFGQPILIRNNQVTRLKRVERFDEAFIQDLVFKNADCLPISEIDDVYSPLIPVCTELKTAVGPLDILMVTPAGRLAIVETKLWRNPEARRKVVAQILDYAKELAKWEYEDLQREINRRLGGSGNTLYGLVCGSSKGFEPEEAAFVDAMSRNLRRGRFLLLVVGDGIREGAEGIADFLSTAGHLDFSFAMVEVAVFEGDNTGTIVFPRVIARTVELHRVVVEIPEGLEIRDSSETVSPVLDSRDRTREAAFYHQFWSELISELDFDDPGQPLPEPNKSTNLFLRMPTKEAWISAYFMKSSKRVGVYVRCSNTQRGREIAQELDADHEKIIEELGGDVIWAMGEESRDTGVRFSCDDVFDPANREQIKDFFADWMNRLVNVFRPRLKGFRE